MRVLRQVENVRIAVQAKITEVSHGSRVPPDLASLCFDALYHIKTWNYMLKMMRAFV
eukprot:COSAG06_NODE_3234_length_5639_cov_7.668177_2_plen_57_part_00